MEDPLRGLPNVHRWDWRAQTPHRSARGYFASELRERRSPHPPGDGGPPMSTSGEARPLTRVLVHARSSRRWGSGLSNVHHEEERTDYPYPWECVRARSGERRKQRP